jgi:hypothetical protein
MYVNTHYTRAKLLTAATPEKRVKESEVNVQEEMWKFIAATLK